MPELRPYQEQAIEFLHANGGRALIGHGPGAGKTATALQWLASQPAGRTLIVCPNGLVQEHWRDQITAWTPASCGPLVIGVCRGTPKRRQETRDCVARIDGRAFLIVSYEILRQDIELLAEIPWDYMICDESHRLKNRSSVVQKAADKLARRVPKVALLTGTPIINGAEELWSSLHLLEPDRYRAFWRWAEHYFDIQVVRRGKRWVREIGDVRPERLQELRKSISGRILYRDINELLPELPEVTETVYEVDLSPGERKVYDELEAKFWTTVDGNVVQALNAASKQQRLRQLASDWSAFSEGIEGVGTKGRAAMALIEDLAPEKVVVFCAFRATVNALYRALDGDAVAITGLMSPHLREEAMYRFTNGKPRVLIVTLGTMSEGVDGLQHVARNAIFIDRDWTPAKNDQAIGRLRRQGQRSAVNVMHIVARSTVDEVVTKALQRKQSVVDAVLCSRQETVSPAP